MLVGLVNGVLITRFNVAPFIATLGMLYVARGIALLITNGADLHQPRRQPGWATPASSARLGSRPSASRCRSGSWSSFAVVFASCCNRSAVRPLALRHRRQRAGGRAVRRPGQEGEDPRLHDLRASAPRSPASPRLADSPPPRRPAGDVLELNAIAAVVIGGAALSGGRGTVRGTLIGAFVIGFLADGLVIVGVSASGRRIKGAVIILAVVVDQCSSACRSAGPRSGSRSPAAASRRRPPAA